MKPNSIISYKKICSKLTLKGIKQHYTEAKLVQLLEEKGIGRPSTFSSLVDKIQERGYVKKEDIKGKEYYSIASGEIAEGTKVIIKKLEIAGKTLYNIEASIVHTLSAPLLLGQSALQKFGGFSVDYSTNSLIIGKQVKSSTTSISVNSQTDIKYYNTHHLYYTVVGLNLYDPSTKTYAGKKELSGIIDLDIPNRLIIVTTAQGVNKFEILKTSIFTIDNNESALEVIIKDEKNESVVFSNNPKLVVFNPIKADAKTLTFLYSNITTVIYSNIILYINIFQYYNNYLY
jgi:hypothetical protein